MNPSPSSHPAPSAWQVLGHKTLLETRIFSVRSTQFRHPVRRDERDFVVIDPPDWVNVIAVTPDGKIVLVRQFRYGANSFSLEIPGGVIERGELPEVAGVRELQEETGYVGSPARVLGTVQPNPAIQSNRCHFLLVEHAIANMPLAWDQDEEIELNVLPVEEAFALARSGGITHALTLNAFFLFEPFWNARKKPI
ncbi:MAG TPA: NUDIX hydrolase [Opitutus sp.]|nr:NUDIX hydrolase [Opitutus sp.]